MLVLSRKSGQAVVIQGTDRVENVVKVAALAIGGGGVRLGFEAGSDVAVHREGVWERILAERPSEPSKVPHEQLDRWADDGGPEPGKNGRGTPVTG